MGKQVIDLSDILGRDSANENGNMTIAEQSNDGSSFLRFEDIAEFATAIIIVIVMLYLIKKFYKIFIPPYSKQFKAIISAWLIWGLCIFTYNELFEAYYDDVTVWLILPPICVIAIYLWIKKFILN